MKLLITRSLDYLERPGRNFWKKMPCRLFVFVTKRTSQGQFLQRLETHTYEISSLINSPRVRLKLSISFYFLLNGPFEGQVTLF